MSIWGGLIGAAGSVLSSGMSLLGGLSANHQSAKEARRARKMLDRLSRTQHQREVEDLRAAGLNPILSAGGSGAAVSTPPTASIDNPARGVQFDLNIFKNMAELDRLESEKSYLDAQSAKAAADVTQGAARTAAEVSRLSSAAALDRSRAEHQSIINRYEDLNRQFEIDLKAYGKNQAILNYRRSEFQLQKDMNDVDFWNSPYGRRIRELQELRNALPQGAILDLVNRGFFNVKSKRPVYRNYGGTEWRHFPWEGYRVNEIIK